MERSSEQNNFEEQFADSLIRQGDSGDVVTVSEQLQSKIIKPKEEAVEKAGLSVAGAQTL